MIIVEMIEIYNVCFCLFKDAEVRYIDACMYVILIIHLLPHVLVQHEEEV